jgi:hypothetical protein
VKVAIATVAKEAKVKIAAEVKAMTVAIQEAAIMGEEAMKVVAEAIAAAIRR